MDSDIQSRFSLSYIEQGDLFFILKYILAFWNVYIHLVGNLEIVFSMLGKENVSVWCMS